MNRFDAVLFDLDGTLLYTLADIAAAVNGALREMHRPERTVTEIRSMVGNRRENAHHPRARPRAGSAR